MEPISMEAAKAKPVVGTVFANPKGAIGTILEGKSEHGKVRAEFVCTGENEGGVRCTTTFIREVSDWHQCFGCPSHVKKGKGNNAGQSTSLQQLAANDPELAALLEEDARVKAAIKAQKDAKKAETKAVTATERAKAQAKARLERSMKLASELGVPVSNRTVTEAQE